MTIRKCPRCTLEFNSEGASFVLCPVCMADLDSIQENQYMSESQAMLQAERDAEMKAEVEDAD